MGPPASCEFIDVDLRLFTPEITLSYSPKTSVRALEFEGLLCYIGASFSERILNGAWNSSTSNHIIQHGVD